MKRKQKESIIRCMSILYPTTIFSVYCKVTLKQEALIKHFDYALSVYYKLHVDPC